MKHPKISICRYPTTIAAVDDNKSFLTQLKTRLMEVEGLPCIAFGEPQKALQFFNNDYTPNPFINHCLVQEEDSSPDHVVADLNVRAIHQEIYNPQRFAEITTLLVDYAMPGLDGLNFCRKLKGSMIKIIMLTGEAGKDIAVQAFNEGSIDRFIMKSEPDLLGVLIKTIRELQTDYFLRLSEIALNKISGFSEKRLAFLEDPVFVNFFHQLCYKHQVAEYYLMDNQGSFLFMNAAGEASWLAVANELQMHSYYLLAEDDNAPAAILTALKNKQKIPYFHSEKDFMVRPAEWQNYLHPAQTLSGKETYYYAYIDNPEIYQLHDDTHKKIISYQQYLAGLKL